MCVKNILKRKRSGKIDTEVYLYFLNLIFKNCFIIKKKFLFEK